MELIRDISVAEKRGIPVDNYINTVVNRRNEIIARFPSHSFNTAKGTPVFKTAREFEFILVDIKNPITVYAKDIKSAVFLFQRCYYLSSCSEVLEVQRKVVDKAFLR